MQADNGRLNARDQKIWHDYTLGGKTQKMLAEEHGVSYQRISQILREIRESLPQEDRQLIIDLRLNQISAGIEALMPGVIAGDKDAITSWKILHEREAKLLGLDASQKVEHSGGVRYEIIGLGGTNE